MILRTLCGRVVLHRSVLLALCAVGALALPGEAQSPDTRTMATELRDSVSVWVDRGWLVGAEVMVVTDGRTVLHDAVGFADRESGRRLDTHSVFRIRSMAKPFLGTATLMLEEAGRLSLDDRVADHLGAFDNERAGDIRIHELLTHTSGLGNHGRGELDLPMDPDEYEALDDLVRDIGWIGPTYPRGQFRYSDSGSAALAALISAVAGIPVDTFLKQRIFEPLGMRDTHSEFAPDSTWAARLSSTYRWNTESRDFDRFWSPDRPQRYRYYRGGGGIYSTTQDYARFIQMWLSALAGESELLSESSASAALAPTAGRPYGYHWGLPDAPPQSGMPPSFLHGGMDGTLAVAIPALNTVVLVFSQSRGVPLFSWILGTLSRTHPTAEFVPSEYRRGTQRLEPALMVRPPIPLDASSYVGSFEARDPESGEAYLAEVWRTEEGLAFRWRTAQRPGLAMRDLVHTGGNRFALGRVSGGELAEYFPEDGILEFVTQGGQVGALRFRGLTFSRIASPSHRDDADADAS